MAYMVMKYTNFTPPPVPDLLERVAPAVQWLRDLPHATYLFGLVRACTSLYELKSRKVDEEPRIQKKLIPKCIFRRSEAQKTFFSKSRQVNKYMDIFLCPYEQSYRDPG